MVSWRVATVAIFFSFRLPSWACNLGCISARLGSVLPSFLEGAFSGLPSLCFACVLSLFSWGQARASTWCALPVSALSLPLEGTSFGAILPLCYTWVKGCHFRAPIYLSHVLFFPSSLFVLPPAALPAPQPTAITAVPLTTRAAQEQVSTPLPAPCVQPGLPLSATPLMRTAPLVLPSLPWGRPGIGSVKPLPGVQVPCSNGLTPHWRMNWAFQGPTQPRPAPLVCQRMTWRPP